MANNDNIIYARFNHGHEITTDPRSQYAYGQVVKISGLHLPASFDADIANKGDKQAKAVIGTNNELPIDDNYFLSGKDIIVMINVHATDKDGRTKYIINIPIEKRSKRADIELEPVEQDVVSTAIATLNEAVERTSADVESAENSASRAHESAVSAEQSATNASNSETLTEQYMERAETAAESSEKSETNAKASEESAKQSESHAEQIANDIEQFTERAETASRNAESSATTAIEKADEISESADIATTKADEASNAATYAGEAATYAGEFANSASASANKAELNAQKTQSDKEVVELAKSDVMSAVDSAQNYAESAQSANQAIQDMNVQAVTLDVGSDVTVEKTVDPATGAVTLTYGIPKGIKGDKGDTGEQGIQGIQGEKGDKGDQGIQGIQGEKGEQGDQGIQGERGEKGEKGDKGDAFTYSDFTPEQLASLKGEKGDKGDTGAQGIQGDKGEKGDKGDTGDDYILTQADKEEIAGLVDTPVDDVQINGTSIIENGIANIPIAEQQLGLVYVTNTGGLYVDPYSGIISLNIAGPEEIKSGKNNNRSITPIMQSQSTFYGLAKAAGHDEIDSTLPVGTYTDEAKASIKNMLGVEDIDIDSKAPVITETISGDIVSFDDGANDMPLQSLVVDINPVQDLNGYDSPWVGGGGKNKFPGASDIGGSSSRYGLTWIPQEDGGMKISGTVDTATWLYSDRYIDFEKFYGFSIGDTIAVSGKDTAGDYMTAIHFYNGSTLLVSLANGNSAVIPEGTTRVRLLFYAKGSAPGVIGETINNTVYMQIEEGSTATDWTPYENICPISGWEGMEIQHTGKNLFDGVIESGDYNVTPSVGGVKRAAADRMRCANFIPVKSNTTYYSKMPYSNSVVVFYDEKKWMRSNGGYAVARNTTFTTPSWCKYITFYFNGTEYNNDISINYPATDTDYHPYTGRSITIDLGQTVYGGYVDVINGELVVDRAIIELRGQWRGGSIEVGDNTVRVYYSSSLFTPTILPNNKNNVINIYADKLQVFVPDYIVRNDVMGISENKNTFSNGFWVRVDKSLLNEATQQGIADWLAQNPITVCYKLAEPIHYPLASNQINSLYGQNNIWADTGNSEVTYRADTELYIDKQIPDVPVDDVQVDGASIVENGVASIPFATDKNFGVTRIGGNSYGLKTTGTNILIIRGANLNETKLATHNYAPIVPSIQYASTFYGLAKAAGDTTQSTSSNAVGTYTDSAKTAIKNMLGVIDGGGTISETITGTDPTITAQNNFRYMCGELYTLNFTPCVSGVCEVIFTSGATPTVLTLPDTVRMPAWWTGVEANTTYEISIVDGVYGAVMSWS